MLNFELVHALTDERMLSQDERTFLSDGQLDGLELQGFGFFEPDIEMGADEEPFTAIKLASLCWGTL